MWPGSEGTFPGGESRLELSDELPLRMSPRAVVGLFSYQPFSFFSRCRGRISCGGEGRFSHVDKVFLVAAAAVMLFYLFFTVEFGGWAYGFRYLMPVIPIPVAHRPGAGCWKRGSDF